MTRRRVALAALLAAVTAGAGTERLAAQESARGVIRGVVVDSLTDSAVAGAHVLLPGAQLSASSDDSGAFVITGLTPGTYDLRVLAIGFTPVFRKRLVVAAGATLDVRIAMDREALQLEGIDVTATGSAQRVGEEAVSVAVLQRQDLLRHSAVGVSNALAYVPGVDMEHGEVDIRGASGVSEGIGSRVLMLLDGHPVLTGDGGEIDYEQLPIMDVERVEVVKGSQSALYGSAAMGGVVNLITAPIDPQPATAMRLHYGVYDLPSEFRFGGPRPDYWGLDLQHSFVAGPVGMRLAVGREASEGYQQNGEYSRYLARLKLTSMPGASHPWDAYVIWATIRQGQFYGWLADSQPYQVPPVALGDWNRVNHVLAGASYAAVAGSHALLKLDPSLSFVGVRDHMHDSQNWHEALRSELNTQLAFNPGSEHAVTFGVDVAGTAVNSSYYGYKWITDAAPYGQEELAVSRALRLTAGVRVDYHHVDGGRAEETINPKIAAAYTTDGPFALRASFGRGYRAPSAIEQFVATTQQGARVVPDSALHGETAWSGELGGSATLGRVWVDGAVFQTWYRGLIGPAAVPGQLLTFSFQNVQRAQVRGLDATAKVSLAARRVDLSCNYLYLDTRDDSTGLPLPYRSRNTVTASMDLLGGLAGLDVQYRSRVEQVLEYPLDPRGDITTVALRVGARLKGVMLFAQVSNLLQARYVDVMERNQGAPRSLLVTAMTGL
jgi:outer membrane receptor for ferrienterochelin and colicins